MKDRRGAEIEVGYSVAYNLSGGVAIGTIEHIIPKELSDAQIKAGASGFNVYIKPHPEWTGLVSKRGLSKLECWTTYGDVVDKIVVL